MTIERLHSDEGYPVTPDVPIEKEATRLMLDNHEKVIVLPEGVYDLTKDLSVKNSKNYGLMVYGNGNGVFKETDEPIIRLPQDQEIIIFVASIKNNGQMGIFDIIRHVPGTGPIKEPEEKARTLVPAGAA